VPGRVPDPVDYYCGIALRVVDVEYEGRGKKYSAEIAVSSVSVAVYDSTYRPLYLHYGGLEPLMYRAGEQLEVLSSDKFFLEEKKIREAAEIAVDPF